VVQGRGREGEVGKEREEGYREGWRERTKKEEGERREMKEGREGRKLGEKRKGRRKGRLAIQILVCFRRRCLSG